MPVAANKLILSNQVRWGSETRTVEELGAAFARRMEELNLHAGRTALTSDSTLDLVAAAVWLAQTQEDGLVVLVNQLIPPLASRLCEDGCQIIDLALDDSTAPTREVAGQRGRVTLLTSGTTGEPKLVEHTWESLFTMGKVRASGAHNWLLTYQGGTYAWFQMLTLLLFVPNQSLTLAKEHTPAALFQAAREQSVSAISSTPTLWRLGLLQVPAEELRAIPLRQITLGGEAVDQAILDQLRGLYPKAMLTHIYASTEAGACIVVRDGKEGFPAAWLSNGASATSPATPQLQARDGFLWLQSPYASRDKAGWLNTGDRIEVRGDRAIILGRAESAFINVGGAKVAAQEVERVLLEHPAILWCRVHRCPAPLMGELVGADVVIRPGAAKPAEAELAQFCAKRMAEHMVPRLWKFLDQIPATGNLKSALA